MREPDERTPLPVQPPNVGEDVPLAGPAPDTQAANPRRSPSHGNGGSQWLLKIGLEALLISLGVFLALMGDQWRENVHIRELTEGSLRRFRAEIVTNRKAVIAVKDYHIAPLKSLEAYAAADPKARQSDMVQLKGLQPVFFERTAWDLALATQSLAHHDPQVAFSLSRIYGAQQGYADFTRGIMQAVYLRPIIENFEALRYYYGDIVLVEAELLRMYDEILPQIDRALGE